MLVDPTPTPTPTPPRRKAVNLVVLNSIIVIGYNFSDIHLTITTLGGELPFFTITACAIYSISSVFYLLITILTTLVGFHDGTIIAYYYHRHYTTILFAAKIWECITIALIIASMFIFFDYLSEDEEDPYYRDRNEKGGVITLLATQLPWRLVVVYSFFSFVREVISMDSSVSLTRHGPTH
jgi:ABC-type microcin C transport system permease subunit YejE